MMPDFETVIAMATTSLLRVPDLPYPISIFHDELREQRCDRLREARGPGCRVGIRQAKQVDRELFG